VTRRLVPALLACAVPAFAATGGHGLWLTASPQGEAEARLSQAVSAGFDSGAARAQALLRLSEENPGTPVSGLAQLAAGFLLLEAGKAAEAAAAFQHKDIARTAVPEQALFGLQRALLETKDLPGAARAALAAADAAPDSPASCRLLLDAADTLHKVPRHDRELQLLQRAEAPCAKRRAALLFALAKAHDAAGDLRAAAAAYERLDLDYATSAEAREAAPRLRALAAYLPPVSAAEGSARGLRRALSLSDAGRHSDAIVALRALPIKTLSTGEVDLVRARLGRAFVATGRVREAELSLNAIRPGSAYEAEAAYQLARLQVRRTGKPDAFEAVATRFAGSEWAEESLLSLANHYQKDARDEEALPYYRRLLEGYPEGRYVERASWRVGWGDFRGGRYEEAAAVMEKTARLRPKANVTPGLLYWSGRARLELGQAERARALFDEGFRRYKYVYHGIRAREALQQLPPGPYTPPVSEPASEPEPAPRAELDGPAGERIRQLLLLERFDDAEEELRAQPDSTLIQGTLAWLEWKRGRLRPAINAMKRAHPEYLGEGGDRLPIEAWRILYPLQYGDMLREKAIEEGLDPSLVAALVCQESTFDAGAVSVAGARGLMQIIPPTGRALARSLGVTYQRASLHRPETSLDFGTRYLRTLMDQFGGRVERALAGYNAGPHRVVAWTAGRPEMSAEEFIESIPFSETRLYVMTILGTQEQYRRIYGLSAQGRTVTDSR
jgi:soluble lytic murein transglycosylase